MKKGKVTLNIFALVKKLEAMKGRNYTIAEIVSKTGLHRNTVRGLLRGTSRRIDLDSLTAFVDFFGEEGMVVSAGELLITRPALNK